MEILGELLNVLDADMKTPVPYGTFHLTFFVTSILAVFGLLSKAGTPDVSFIRRLLLVSSLTVIALEVYKQINFTFYYDGDTITADYQWYAFPFQFCSTPMYVGLMAALTKNKRLYERLCAYLATYGLFAGVCVMVYPVSVFMDTIGINIQTMICHGAMVTIGLYLLASGAVKLDLTTLKKALPVFCVLVTMAVVLNELAYRAGISGFNMFFLSPYCKPELPVFSMIQPHVPFAADVLIYVLAFTAGSSALLIAAQYIRFLHRYAFGWKRIAHRFA